MRELDRIRRALSAAATRGADALLATVMNVDGSVYRGAGARMVVSQGGETTGGVSGGCLEADIVARADELFVSGRAELVQYDTRTSDDAVLGLGLGCQGVIDVLLEPLAGDALESAIALYAQISGSREPVILMTLVRNRSPHVTGSRVLLHADGSVAAGEPAILDHVADLAREEVLPALPLVICGGGNDAIPLARIAKSMGWHVTVVDHRPSFATPERFPEADVVLCFGGLDEPQALKERASLDARTVAVSMAHSAAHDRMYLHQLLDAGARYVGVLGPRRRTLELLGDRFDGELPDNLYSPIGLDTGAETPEEIALSIVAEIAAVAAGRDGGHLRDRSGPIHRRERALP